MPDKGKYEDLIDRFLAGQLTAAERETMQKALDTDKELAQETALRRLEFEAAEALIAHSIRSQLQHLQAVQPPYLPTRDSTKKRRPAFLKWLIAAILALAAIGVYWWKKPAPPLETPLHQTAPINSSPTPTEPQATIQAPPTLPSQHPQGTIASPARYLALADKLYQKPAVETFRGAATSNNGDPFDAALTAWAQSDYPSVLTALAKVPADDPKYIRALYLKAHAHFQLRQFEAAANLFTTVSDRKIMPFSEDSDGYLLLALLATGQANTSNFRAHLRQVLSDPGHPWHEQAAEIKRQL